MDTEKNTRLYWQWFAMWIGLTMIAFASLRVLAPTLDRIGAPSGTFLAIVISQLPILVMAIYGLWMNYFPGTSWSQIRRGKSAVVWNVLLIGVFVLVLVYGVIRVG